MDEATEQKVTAWMPRELVARVDAWGEEQTGGLSRTRAMRVLLERALVAEGRPSKERRTKGVRA